MSKIVTYNEVAMLAFSDVAFPEKYDSENWKFPGKFPEIFC